MEMKKHKIWKIPQEEDQTGLLLWFQILQKHYLSLFYANILGVLSLLPAAYFAYLLFQTGDLLFWLLGLMCFCAAAPCQTGMHSVCVRLVHRMPVWVKEDFALAWKREWKQSMAMALVLGVLWSALAWGVSMALTVDGGLSLSLALLFLVVAYLLTGMTLFSFQQLAMVELPLSSVFKNAILLIFAGKLRSVFAIVVPMAMALVPVIYYGLAAYILLAGWLALMVMTANLIFAPVFAQLFLSEDRA